MSETNRVEFEILGQRYTIRSDASPDYVRELAAHLEQRLEEVRGEAGGHDPVKLLVIAALAITDELFRQRDEQARSEGEVSERVGALVSLLDSLTPQA